MLSILNVYLLLFCHFVHCSRSYKIDMLCDDKTTTNTDTDEPREVTLLTLSNKVIKLRNDV